MKKLNDQATKMDQVMTKNRNQQPRWSGALLCLCALTWLMPLQAQSEEPLNVLFILTDDQAPYTVSAHGYDQISTPAIDSLAESGMSFNFVFNQGSWSGAVCAPSRRMINTGRHLYHTGMDPRKKHKADYTTFGESFRAAGYDTFQTGKWHLPMNVWEKSFTHGKAVFKGGMSRHEMAASGMQHFPISTLRRKARRLSLITNPIAIPVRKLPPLRSISSETARMPKNHS